MEVCKTDCNHIRCAFLKPFIIAYPYVLKNPLSKRMPKGLHCDRRGLTSIEVFCYDFQALSQNMPICNDYDFNKAFKLMDKLFVE